MLVEINLSDLSSQERARFASNASTPAEALAWLSKDEDPYVRKAVASNESTPAVAKMSSSS